MDKNRDKPEDSGGVQKEYRRIYNDVFNPLPFGIKLLYRGPLVLLEILLLVALTAVIPVVTGLLIVYVLEVAAEGASLTMFRLVAAWVAGLMFLGGAGLTVVVLVAVWQAVVASLKRTWEVLRKQ